MTQQEFVLTVPPNWPLAWWSDNNVKMACPSCGGFSALLDRAVPDKPKITCDLCGLTGLDKFQRAFGKVSS